MTSPIITPALDVIREKMRNTLIKMDIKKQDAATPEERRYGLYALPIVFRDVDTAIAEMAAGASLARAIFDNFDSDVMIILERAFHLPITTWGDAASGRPD